MENKEKNFISAVIYVHNDSAHVSEFVRSVVQVLRNHFEKFEIICVNDASTDDSVGKIKEVAAGCPNSMVTVLNMSCFHGGEMAMHAGMDLAIGDFVFEFDTVSLDFNMDLVRKVYQKALQGYDIVSASPAQKQKCMSRLFYYVFEKCTNLNCRMNTETFRILSRRVINRICSMNQSLPYRKAIYANCGLKTATIKYQALSGAERKRDRQEHRYRKNLAVDSIVLFTELGYRCSAALTLVMMLIAVFAGIYAASVYLCHSPVAGWTTTILFLSLGFFGLFFLLTVVIKYLAILLELVFKKERYSFESVEKMTHQGGIG